MKDIDNLCPEEHYIDFHTHRMRYGDRNDVVEIVSLHHGKDVDHNLFTIGRHPWWTESVMSDQERSSFIEILTSEKCLALGEIGLDKLKGAPMTNQELVLQELLSIAAQRQLPVVIHCVRAFDTLLRIKKDYPTIPRWCIHGYARHATLAKQLIDHGFFLSLMPQLNPKSKEGYQQLITSLPLDRFFLETDSMPQADIIRIYEHTSKLLRLDLPLLKHQMCLNARDFFDHPF